jgi:methyl-accepting chemotaxis protein
MTEVNKSNERIKDIVSVISEISTKTNVINDIVFQTKLLSFNASVEAARAGEHGKGFAVVAEEVGNLAQMSGNAAKEISVLLDQSISRVNQIISETNTGVERVIKNSSQKIETGVKTAEKCDAVLSEIVEIAIVVKNMMNEVAHASKEQATGVQNISQAMNQVDQMVHSNETSASKSNETAQKLLEQSNELKKVVGNIESVIFGGNILKLTKKEKDSPPPTTKTEKKVAAPQKKITVEEKKIEPIKIAKVNAPPKEVKVTSENNNKETNNAIPSADDKRFEDV